MYCTYIAVCVQVYMAGRRTDNHRVDGQQLNDCVGTVGGFLHLAISVPSMIIFLAKARTSPPKCPTNKAFNSQFTRCCRSDCVSCASHLCIYVVSPIAKLCHLLVWISCHSISCSRSKSTMGREWGWFGAIWKEIVQLSNWTKWSSARTKEWNLRTIHS